MEWRINSDLCTAKPFCSKCSVVSPQIFDTSGETATIIRQPEDKIETARCEEVRQICLGEAIYTWSEPPPEPEPVIEQPSPEQPQDTPPTDTPQ